MPDTRPVPEPIYFAALRLGTGRECVGDRAAVFGWSRNPSADAVRVARGVLAQAAERGVARECRG